MTSEPSSSSEPEIENISAPEILTHLPAIVLILDCRGAIASANDFAVSFLGYPRDGVEGESILALIPASERSILSAALDESRNSPIAIACEHHVRLGNGELCPVTANLRRIASGENPRLLLVWERQTRSNDVQIRQAQLALQQGIDRERILSAIARHIRESLDPEEVLNATVADVRQFLDTDRVVIYRFNPDGSGVVIVESVGPDWTPMLGRTIFDGCLVTETCIEPYTRGKIHAVPDIHAADYAPCYVDLLSQFQVRGNLVVPILQESPTPDSSETGDRVVPEPLWGLLVAQSCAAPRVWEPFEIELLQHLSTQVSIALKQGDLYRKLQAELAERRQTEGAIQNLARRLLTIIETVGEGLTLSDEGGNFGIFNRKMEEITGYRASEVTRCGDFLSRLYPDPGDRQTALANLERVRQTGKIQNVETTIRAQDGAPKTLLVSTALLPHENGTWFLSSYRDITHRKQAQIALERERAKLTEAQEIAHVGFWELQCDTQTYTGSGETFRILGLDRPTEPRTLEDLKTRIDPRDLPAWEGQLGQLTAEGKPVEFEHRLLRPSGEIRYVLIRGKPIRDETGRVTRIFGTILDITPQKLVEIQLWESEARLSTVVNSTSDGLLIVVRDDSGGDDGPGRVQFANPAATRLLNRPLSDLIGRPLGMAVEVGQIATLEIARPGGEPGVGEMSVAETEWDGRPAYVLCLRDVTEQRRAEEQLQFQAQLLDNVRESVVATDLEGRVRYWSKGAETLYGYRASEAIGQPIASLVATSHTRESESDRIRQVLETGYWRGQSRQYRRDGSSFWADTVISLVKDRGGNPSGLIGIDRDITQRHEAEEALQQAHQRLSFHVNNSPLAVVEWDRELRACYWSKRAEATFGWRSEEVVGRHWREWLCVWEGDLPVVETAIAQIFDNMVPSYSMQIRNYTRDGTPIACEWYNSVLRNSAGELVSILSLVLDVSDRHQAEVALRESEKRFRTLVSNLPGAIYRCLPDVPWQAIYVSDEIEAITGYEADRFFAPEPVTLADITHPDDLEMIRPLVEIALARRQPYIFEYRLIAADGSIRWVYEKGQGFWDENDNLLSLDGAIFDISDRKRAELELERLHSQMIAILNAAGEGICGLDLEDRIAFTNPAAAQMLGYEISELTGKSLGDIVCTSGGDRDPTSPGNPLICEPLESGEIARQSEFHRRDGSQFPVDYVYTPVHQKRVNLAAVLTFKDITERRAVEQMKNEFLSVVSHELRTPLTSMRASLGLMGSGRLGELSPQLWEMLKIAIRNTDRLGRLIDDLLDVQRLESGRVEYEFRSHSLRALFTQAVKTMQTMAQEAQVELAIAPMPESPESLRVWADGDRILQVLTNLLSNAIKFSPPQGRITLLAEVLPEEDKVLIRVRDRGRGVPPHLLEHIFEPFRQVDASDSRQKGGTGLGLTICRQIVNQHGGHIWAENIPEGGCQMSLTLAIARES